ncbi:TetR/AcrR family transcriptional regulator, partial [Massilia cavernae]
MRLKTETKRQAILDVAAQVFREGGFERSSMNEICQRVGGSKATIYNYFASKEELFFEVMRQSADAEFEQVHAALDVSTEDIAKALETFGQRLITFIYSPQLQSMRRLVISESGRADLGRKCYENGPARSLVVVSAFLSTAMEQGKLRKADARTASLQLKALYEAEFHDRFMCHILDELDSKDVKQAVTRAV